MTREELIEVMARGICAGQGMYWEDEFGIYSSNGDPSAHDPATWLRLEAFKHDAAAALAAIETAGVVVLILVEPDDIMLAAGMESDSIAHHWEPIGAHYKMMVSASPKETT